MKLKRKVLSWVNTFRLRKTIFVYYQKRQYYNENDL